jgi:glyoxylase-like metal-dependent hydrolase (beta-lactamase superfamily II)
MNRLSCRVVIVATALALTVSLARTGAQAPQPAQRAAADFNAFPVQGAVSLVIGPDGLASSSANITVQTSDDAVVLVDTGRGDTIAAALSAIRQVSQKPIRFIINTQAAADHTGGNEALAKSGRPYGGRASGAGFLLADQSSGATIIAHENVLSALSGARGGPSASFGMLPTETYFTPEHELFSGEAIQLFHAPAALTDGDSIVFFRRSDVISAGDVFSTQGYPRLNLQAGGSINGEIAALNHILDLAIPRDKQEGGTYIIPGHGRISDEADVVEYRDMLVIIRDRVQDLLMKGRTLDQIKTAKVSFDYDRRYSTPQLTGEQFVESIVTSLTPAPPGQAPTNRTR